MGDVEDAVALAAAAQRLRALVAVHVDPALLHSFDTDPDDPQVRGAP
ncbi:hypothetical protein ACFQV2_30470 [Actinokineospora soli]|uniref:Uncharacterized protein n=1 Tax=Actinokineospora soli TaxID=1048753 RepID=A0ABW2TV64_9PSEU